jgi:very-short-patch-repair endonuclease
VISASTRYLSVFSFLAMRKNQVHNQPVLKETRRILRANLTAAEAVMWKALRGSQVAGRKFRRQHSVGPYVLDFYCPQEHLAVELDGHGHFTPSGQAYDADRDAYLNSLGIRVLRFENRFVFSDLESILHAIEAAFTPTVR